MGPIQIYWYLYKNRKCGHTQKPQETICTTKRPCEDTIRSSCPQAKNESSEETKTADTLTLEFQNCEKIAFCCLNHPVCGPLSWQIQQTNMLGYQNI